MRDHILFLTGKLAEKSLHRVLDSMQPTEFTYEVRQVRIQRNYTMYADGSVLPYEAELVKSGGVWKITYIYIGY